MINARLSHLREKMRQHNVHAYIMPLGDPHQSEYPASYWKSLAWISGFTGSAGTVVITLDHAGLWTDSRYFIQGEQELSSSEFVLHKLTHQTHPTYMQWVAETLTDGQKVVIDGPMFSLAQKDRLEKMCHRYNVQVEISHDFIGDVWSDRPALPLHPVFDHKVKFAGKSREHKLADVREYIIDEENADYGLITTLDDIAWLYNLRGSDVNCNPVFIAFTIISRDKAYLFINEEKVDVTIQADLNKAGVELMPYDDIAEFLGQIPADKTILIHQNTINVYLKESITHAKILSGRLISREHKAIKNDTELNLYNHAMTKDGVALANAFYWLDKTLDERTVTEYELAMKLAECRSQQDMYFGESFNAIVGYKGNGAIIHYRPMPDTSAHISKDGMLLVDSGGQYHDGTTDITRTFHFSTPSAKEKNAYTRVLKGHIALAMARFPENTLGGQLDLLARKSLWDDGLNYAHGTGHGVGFFLNVHEPPQGFAPGTSGRSAYPIKTGMVTSNEPGHYVANEYGIRIENLVVSRPASQQGFLEFDTITLYPIAVNLIDHSIMTKEDIDWLNQYHKLVWSALSPHLDAEVAKWLEPQCAAI